MEFVNHYHQVIAETAAFSGMSDRIVVVNACLAIYFGVQLIVRDRRASTSALIAVLALAAVNAVLSQLLQNSLNLSGFTVDTVSGAGWPTIAYAASKYRRARWVSDRKRMKAEVEAALAREDVRRAYAI
jgi:hypothetical protein